jgi:hypothetical protein
MKFANSLHGLPKAMAMPLRHSEGADCFRPSSSTRNDRHPVVFVF